MTIESGDTVLSVFPGKHPTRPGGNSGLGGNSGAVVSPAPNLGLSAYQPPKPPNPHSKGGN